MPGGVELIITGKGDNGILFEGTKGRFFVSRGKLAGTPVEELKDNPLPEGAVEKVYGGPIPKNHSVNFIEAMQSRCLGRSRCTRVACCESVTPMRC